MVQWEKLVTPSHDIYLISEHLIFIPNQTQHQDLPTVVMISVPSYRGPTLWHTPDGIPIVPIVPSISRWETGGQQYSRTQYPLRIAYSVTIHKSQGMTLDKVTIELGFSDFVPAVTFVACSRARAKGDIAFRSEVTFGRLRNLAGLRKIEEDIRRRDDLGFQDGETAEDLGYVFQN
jgi:hypothetical protein